jgi:hypothetical protein
MLVWSEGHVGGDLTAQIVGKTRVRIVVWWFHPRGRRAP